MTRNTYNSLLRTAVGFDRIFETIESIANEAVSGSFPPYDIENTGENKYVITLAVAGYTSNEIEVSLEESVLTIKGNKTQEAEERKYLHRGIAARDFERRFTLADHVEVESVSMKDGMLQIGLFKEVPETKKPKKFDINS